ncbi:MAG: hypothetical protein U0694_10055 [Anaerolineae bacterium]
MSVFAYIRNALQLRTAQHTVPQTLAQHESSDALAVQLYNTLMQVAAEHPSIQMADFDMDVIRQHIFGPVAEYIATTLELAQTVVRQKHGQSLPRLAVQPLIVSGVPGIGKTTLMMMIDEVLTRLQMSADLSCRGVFPDGRIAGYYGRFKGEIQVTPLRLADTATGVLSISDWKNIQLHWTFDSEETYRETDEATSDFLDRLRGKIVFIDDAEKEGHVYFVSQLSQHGILVVVSSNLDAQALHLREKRARAVHLHGIDHRVGDITKVCLSAGEHPLFDGVRLQKSLVHQEYEKFQIKQRGTWRVAYARWSSISNQPMLKDHFASYFKKHQVDAVLVDEFPYFSGLTSADIDPITLGHIYRFVHLIDAAHDLKLPFMLRMTGKQPLKPDYKAQELEQAFRDYDQRVQSTDGMVTWVEVSRCLSRLRSREKLNDTFFPAFLEAQARV